MATESPNLSDMGLSVPLVPPGILKEHPLDPQVSDMVAAARARQQRREQVEGGSSELLILLNPRPSFALGSVGKVTGPQRWPDRVVVRGRIY